MLFVPWQGEEYLWVPWNPERPTWY
jgi:hypothetical protein